jgi:hypothetical protein
LAQNDESGFTNAEADLGLEELPPGADQVDDADGGFADARRQVGDLIEIPLAGRIQQAGPRERVKPRSFIHRHFIHATTKPDEAARRARFSQAPQMLVWQVRPPARFSDAAMDAKPGAIMLRKRQLRRGASRSKAILILT